MIAGEAWRARTCVRARADRLPRRVADEPGGPRADLVVAGEAWRVRACVGGVIACPAAWRSTENVVERWADFRRGG